MESVLIILKQILVMFILAFAGFLMYRYKKITNEGSKGLGNILIYLSLPCVIINSFLVDYTPEKALGLLISAGLAFTVLMISIGLSRLVLGKRAIDNFAGSFSNPGFFGIPIIVASLVDGAVFYVAAFVAFLNMGQWTYGVSLLQNSDAAGNLISGKNSKNKNKENDSAAGTAGNSNRAGDSKNGGKFLPFLQRMIKAPFMIAILIGLLFFLTGIKMPEIPAKCINFIANLNTPLAMFTIGIYLAQTNVGKMFGKISLYKVSLVRLILVPLCTILIFRLVPDLIDPNEMLQMKLALLIGAACPVGSNVAVYAQLHDRDYPYAVETVVISTLFSIITIPAMVGLAGLIW